MSVAPDESRGEENEVRPPSEQAIIPLREQAASIRRRASNTKAPASQPDDHAEPPRDLSRRPPHRFAQTRERLPRSPRAAPSNPGRDTSRIRLETARPPSRTCASRPCGAGRASRLLSRLLFPASTADLSGIEPPKRTQSNEITGRRTSPSLLVISAPSAAAPVSNSPGVCAP